MEVYNGNVGWAGNVRISVNLLYIDSLTVSPTTVTYNILFLEGSRLHIWLSLSVTKRAAASTTFSLKKLLYG